MKAITLTQPWATLVAIGAKTIETRDWDTPYRGELLVTASKKWPSDCRQLCFDPPFAEALGHPSLVPDLPLGYAIAVVNLAGTFRMGSTTKQSIRGRSERGKLPKYEAAFGVYDEGRFGFYLSGLRQLPTPVACRGALGIWHVPADLETQVRHQLAQLN